MEITDEIKKYSEQEKTFWTDFYNKKISKRSKKKFSGYWWEYYHQEITSYIKSFFSQKHPEKVLEVGSGTGKASMLSFPNSKIVLLDLVKESFILARRFAEKTEARNIDCVIGNMFDIPADRNTFDLVWNIGVIEHYEEELLKKILKEMLRVTKVGGFVCVGIPNFKSLPIIKAQLISNQYTKSLFKTIPGYRLGTEKNYNKEQIHELFKSAAQVSNINIEIKQSGYAGSPLLIGTPKFILMVLSPIMNIFFKKNKFLLLVMVKKVSD